MLTIYLANLTHVQDGVCSSSDSIPINIGYLATYLNTNLTENCDIQLFNLPDALESAMDRKIPDILATSSYVWNFQLNYFFLSEYKSRYPKLITIMGGPHYPGNRFDQEKFLTKYNLLDFYVALEGEETFSELVNRLIKNKLNIDISKQSPLQGCQFINDKNFVDGGSRKRKKDLEAIPSPCLEGWLDDFLEGGFVPMLQSNRGCPFKCAFCHSGDIYFNKLNQFPLERVLQEIEYIADRTNSETLNVADDNFGILKRDKQIAQKLAKTKEENGWPLFSCVATSKVNKERVADCIAPIKDTLMFSASMQSLNPETLTAIDRKNLSFDEYHKMITVLNENQIPASTELIMPMPLESAATHLQSIKTTIDFGIDMVCLYTTMLLPNTPFIENPYYDQFSMVQKYRVIPRGFGEYANQKVVETESVCISTSTINFDEYCQLRGFHFVVHSFYNLKYLDEIVSYLRASNVSIYGWLQNIQQRLETDTGIPGKIYQQFLFEAQDEIWDSEDEIFEYYSTEENYQKLIRGEKGSNLLMKYSTYCLENLADVGQFSLQVLFDTETIANTSFLKDLLKYCVAKRGNIFEKEKYKINQSFLFDIDSWKNSDEKSNIDQFMNSISFEFVMTEEQQEIIEKYTIRHGNHASAKGSILGKVGPENLYRKVEAVYQS